MLSFGKGDPRLVHMLRTKDQEQGSKPRKSQCHHSSWGWHLAPEPISRILTRSLYTTVQDDIHLQKIFLELLREKKKDKVPLMGWQPRAWHASFSSPSTIHPLLEVSSISKINRPGLDYGSEHRALPSVRPATLHHT